VVHDLLPRRGTESGGGRTDVGRHRRAPTVVCYWSDRDLIAHNYATRVRTPAPPLALEILDFCGDWRTLEDVFAAFPNYPRAPLRRLVRLLTERTLLERTLEAAPSPNTAMHAWRPWMPEAAFFHFATKDVRYGPQRAMDEQLARKAATDPAPPPAKTYADLPRIGLPAEADLTTLADVLRARRTWRRFDARPIELRDIATLVGLTWRVQRWVGTGVGRCALKTSPSGGARHPIEAYVLARHVNGLAQGCYHYDSDAHALVLLKRGLTAGRLDRYLAGQSCYADAGAVVVMTAVFARAQWRYEFPRAYRVVLLDAGHLCQTFCLVATALGLAPFCTAALADSLIERDLGLDGVTESVIYACGVGTRPPGVDWAPWPTAFQIPNSTF
jgi:SagB-type dehydrogenase family enzyme